MPGIYFRQKLVDYLLFAKVFEAQICANRNNKSSDNRDYRSFDYTRTLLVSLAIAVKITGHLESPAPINLDAFGRQIDYLAAAGAAATGYALS